MAKVHQLSPENYIRTKARTLPVYKCLVTPGWQQMGMANVVIMRRHVNGNCTAGLYLVDLMCLGIKDTFYLFNETEENIEERFNIGEAFFTETDYITAHNIVYAGHDYAAEYEIEPHKDFEITKYILEEDDERIPVIDISVGNEEGKPHLMVSSTYNYGPALQKLKKNAGEGNYQFTIGEDDFDDNEDDFDENDSGGENDDFDENDSDQEEDFFDDFDDDDESDDDYTPDDFNIVRNEDTDALTEALEDEELLMIEKTIIRSELLWRKLKEEKPLSVLTDEKLEQTPEMIAFNQNRKAWEEESEATQGIREKVFEEIKEIQFSGLEDVKKLDKFLKLMHKYRATESVPLMVFHAVPPIVLLTEFSKVKKALNGFSPAIQLALAAWNGFIKDKDPELSAKSKAATVQEAFPGKPLHAFHIKCFWLLKAIDALLEKDTKNIIYYHSFIRTTGVSGHLKYLYATLLNVWLCEFLNIPEEDILFQENR
jgi:hypothetical protein